MQISGSAFNAGLATVQGGQQRVDRAAANIASEATSVQAAQRSDGRSDVLDSAQDLVELDQGRYQAQIGAKVIQTADEVLGTLIDTRA